MNVIGDIAGQYDTLIELLKKMPDDEPVSLGDMCDRGPKSKEVFDFFMQRGRAVFGNHEHMCVEYFRNNQGYGFGGYYEPNLWPQWNGGQFTLDQIKDNHEPYVAWLSSLPMYIQEDGYLLTHAPKNPTMPLDALMRLGTTAASEECRRSLLWNRGSIKRIPEIIQLHGHQAYRQVIAHRDTDGEFGYGIDTSRAYTLTGYSTLNKKFYQQEYIE